MYKTMKFTIFNLYKSVKIANLCQSVFNTCPLILHPSTQELISSPSPTQVSSEHVRTQAEQLH